MRYSALLVPDPHRRAGDNKKTPWNIANDEVEYFHIGHDLWKSLFPEQDDGNFNSAAANDENDIGPLMQPWELRTKESKRIWQIWSIEQAKIAVQSLYCGDEFSKPAQKSGRRRAVAGDTIKAHHFKRKSTYQGMVFIEIVRYIANERVDFWVFYTPVFFGLKIRVLLIPGHKANTIWASDGYAEGL